MRKATMRSAFLASLPVMAGYVVLGFAFGVLMENKGYGFLWSAFMSITVFAGSMEFVAVDLLGSGASLISAAIMTVLVNARHLFYGISMLQRYKGAGRAKPYLIFGLTDETYALVVNGAPEGTDEKRYYLLVTLFNQIYWVTGSIAGGLVGAAVTFNTAGIDFAMTALFVVIFTEQLLTADDYVPAVIGVGSALLCLLVFGASDFLIPSMLLITALLLAMGSRRNRSAAK